MGILQIIPDEPGQINQPNVRRVKIITSDNLASVEAAGYLNPTVLQGYFIYNTDIIDMWYGAVGDANIIRTPGTYAEFTPSIVNGVITLQPVIPPSGVTVVGTPTTGHIVRFAGPSSIQDGGVLGLAAAKSVSDNTKSTVASVSGATTIGHIATFADTAGTVQDGGVIGQAAAKSVSDNTKSSVASVSGATVLNNLLKAGDIAGTVQDSGIASSAVQLSANIKSNVSADIGGGGAGPIAVAVVGLTSSSIVVATVKSSSNPVSVIACVAGTGSFDITFSADPGVSCIINYVAFIAAQ